MIHQPMWVDGPALLWIDGPVEAERTKLIVLTRDMERPMWPVSLTPIERAFILAHLREAIAHIEAAS